MSLVGRKPVAVPNGVDVKISGNRIVVKGSKGTLECSFNPCLGVVLDENKIVVTRSGDTPKERAAHGLWRSLINNMVDGVSRGFEKRLEIIGTGYRVKQSGKGLEMNLGFSHPIVVAPYMDNELAVDGANTVIVRGISKVNVGEQAARIRKLRKPNPYTGKGVKYVDEVIKRKAGKTGSGAE